jgi:secreted trypsin-like serine protease
MTRRWMVRLLAICLLAVFAVSPALAVQYGEPDGDGHPHVGLAVFYVDGVPSWRCSGTLLSPTVFLTAGHCTDGADAAQVWFTPERPAGYPVSGGVMGTPYTHPDFVWQIPNTSDVGVIVLESPVDVPSYAQLAPLGTLDVLATRRGQQDVTFKVVGYGVQSIKPVAQAVVERRVGFVELVNLRSALTDGYNIHYTSNPGQGRGGPGGTCFGDSGGAVFLGDSNVIVGVNSFVLNSNCKGSGFAYRTDIANAYTWINSFLQ